MVPEFTSSRNEGKRDAGSLLHKETGQNREEDEQGVVCIGAAGGGRHANGKFLSPVNIKIIRQKGSKI